MRRVTRGQVFVGSGLKLIVAVVLLTVLSCSS